VAKVRDSGMPALEQWESYFDADEILDSFGFVHVSGDAIEFGCGYGTFTIAAARRTRGTFFALDIDPLMLAATEKRVLQADLQNVVIEKRDFVSQGCGRNSVSTQLALLFNILHVENPVDLLRETYRVMCLGGQVAIIHWKYDERTPRGPPLDIRPRPEQCRDWGRDAGFRWVRDVPLPGSRWHWGMLFERT
jgi:SAM-dependent methyltransferase